MKRRLSSLVRRRPHCASCGRFVLRHVRACPECEAAGFEALTLF